MIRSNLQSGLKRALRAIGLLLLPGLIWMLPANVFAQSAQTARDADRGSQIFVNAAAASAATEKVLAQLTADFYANGEAFVDTNVGYYSSLVPLASDNSYWSNYVFLNPQNGVTNSIYVAPQYPVTNVPTLTVMTNGELQGMSAIQSFYRIQSYARQTNNLNTNVIGGTELDVALNSVPLFEFGIYYNSLLEFTTAAALDLNGPVHGNSDIYVGAANLLTFELPVTCSGVITNPAWGGEAQSNWTGTVTFNGTPAPGYAVTQPALSLPIGVSNNRPTNTIQIIYPPLTGDNSVMTQQRYYNKAEMLIMVSNSTFIPSNNLVIVKLQAPSAFGLSYQDPTPYWFTNINPSTGLTNTAWANNGFDAWLSTTNSFYDFRQTQYMRTTQINVSNFNTWCSNSYAVYNGLHGTNKFSAATPLNIIYVADWRATNTTTNAAVRLRGGGGSNFPPYGLTVATPNPLYVWGNYDAPSTNNLNSTNVIGTYPTSFISDALTILSGNWVDSYASSSVASSRPASSTTVNGAIIAGMVYSTGPGGTGTTQFSGGVHNLPRLLENWGTGSVLTLNTSFVNLFPSMVATQPFVWPNTGTVYGVPTRQFYFNQNYDSTAGLPPGTPFVTLVQRTSQTLLNPSGTAP